MPYCPLYSFGYGLSYTTFSYSDLKTPIGAEGNIDVTATVTNTGKLKGDEVVQLYVTDMYASVKTRVMKLKDFERLSLTPGQSQQIKFTLTPYQLSLLNEDMDRVIEPVEFKIMVGSKSQEYIADDQIKNSVGYKTAASGLNTIVDYKKAFKPDVEIVYNGQRKNPQTKLNESSPYTLVK
jgi:beta-glucosidase